MINNKERDIILVVDDAPDSLTLINDALEQAGIDTLVALEGKQALAIAQRMRPDMILLDAMMPNMNGFETCKAIKANAHLANIPVIFMTGLSDTDSILKGLNAGGVDYLTKPVNPTELLARIKVHLHNARLTASAQNALDVTGQNIFTVDGDGNILWGTPQTHALFARANASDQWLKKNFAAYLQSWLVHPLKNGQTLPVQAPDMPLEVTYIEHRSDNDIVLRLSDGTKVSGEERLREKLNLTTRESEVLYWLAQGKTNKDISQILDMGVRTVNKHLEQIFPKLGVENRTSAAAIAIRTLGD